MIDGIIGGGTALERLYDWAEEAAAVATCILGEQGPESVLDMLVRRRGEASGEFRCTRTSVSRSGLHTNLDLA
jgi:hypothetical protein